MPQSDLVVVCIRLRRADIDRAKAIAASVGLGYQTWIRERMSVAARNGADNSLWKIKSATALAIVRADTADAARTAARIYGETLAAERKLPAAAFTDWIASADVAELPETAGVVAWAGVGSPIVAGRSRQKGHPSRSRPQGRRR